MYSPERLAAGREAMAHLTEGLYILARFHPPLASGAPGGRQWERWVAHDLLPRGATLVQGPGMLRLFNCGSASGFRHELDGAARSRWGSVVIEAKAYEVEGPSKNDVCIFSGKTFDMILAQ